MFVTGSYGGNANYKQGMGGGNFGCYSKAIHQNGDGEYGAAATYQSQRYPDQQG